MKSFLSSLAALLLGTAAALAAEKVYNPPALPPGTNPATVPVPREEWLARVQGKFDASQGKAIDLVFDGDSITDFWENQGKAIWAERYAPLNAFDFGISGDRVEHVLWRLQKGQLDGFDPKLVVLMIGTNNTGRNSAEQIAEGIKVLVAEYLQRAPHARLLLLGVFPRAEKPTDPVRAKITRINELIAPLADGQRVTFLDFGAKFLSADGTLSKEIMPDFLHPSAAGYKIWADAIAPEIAKTFPSAPAPAP